VPKERPKSPRGRFFVALDLPEEVRELLAAWQRRELTDPSLRAVPAENLHITLVFLGWQAEKDLAGIAAAAFPAQPPAAPEVELLPEPAARPPGKRPRLFAIEARSAGVEELQAGVSERLRAARLYEPEKRPFWPHLTVARVKPERKGGRRPAMVERLPGALTGTPVRFRPTRLVVFRSHLHRSGARYEPMAELELPPA
jgi:2'-5' RNA ligase